MASSGPNYPGSISTASYSGGVDWTNASNIGADDNTYATVALGNKSSYYLKAQNFGFSIPSSATINGITVEIGAYTTSASRVTYADVQLLDANGTATGTDKGSGYVPTSEGPSSFGGVSDTWSASPTPAMVNDADFGVVFRVSVAAPVSYTTYVDYIRVTITYTVATVSGDGVLQLAPVSTAGEGTVINPIGFFSWPLRWMGVLDEPTGAGTLQVGPITMAGDGVVVVPISGEGTLLMGATSIYGEGVVGSVSDGVLTIGEISIYGEGVVVNAVTVEGSLTAGAISVAGYGLVRVPVTSEGTLTVGAVSLSGSGIVSIKFRITFYRRYSPTIFTVAPRTTEFSMSGRNATIYVPARTRVFTVPSRS